MISFTFYRNSQKILKGFKARNHGRDIVCAGVSILTQNFVNSVEMFTDLNYSLEYDENGGFMEFVINNDEIDDKALLLFKSLELGIKGIEQEYSEDIRVFIKEV